jgi:hypothetical protein
MEDKFDAVKMVRKIRDKHKEETKGKSHQEKMDYYKEKAAAVLNVEENKTRYGEKKGKKK